MFQTASQPKSIAIAADSTVFVAEVNSVEAIRSNQKVFDLQPKFSPTTVAASGPVVAIGGDVSTGRPACRDGVADIRIHRIRRSVCMIGMVRP